MKANKGKRLTTLREQILAPPQKMSFWVTFKQVVAYHWLWYRTHPRLLIIGTALAVLVALGLVRPLEANFNESLRAILTPEKWSGIADFLSWSGEYPFPLLIFLGALLFGTILKRRRLHLVAFCLLASLLFSTLVTRSGKIGFGRLRPHYAQIMQVNDTFAGPSLEPKHHSFPSGHTSSSFSCATPLFLYHPVLGSPAMAGAAAIGLSRAHKSQHYLSDLVAGFWVGLACSLPAYTLLRHKKTKSPIE